MPKRENSSSKKSEKPVFEIIIRDRALKQLATIPKKFAVKIDELILSLADNPYPNGVKKLQGYENIYRARSGDYRIVYTVENRKLVVEIIQIGDRKDIYKKL